MTALLDGRQVPTPHPDVLVEDNRMVVTHYDGVVRAGLGAVVFAGAGVTVDALSGSEVHLAPGGCLVEPPAPGALESLEVCVVAWDGGPVTQGPSRESVTVDEPCAAGAGLKELALIADTRPGAA